MTCREVAEFLRDYLSDELPESARREFDAHLKLCVDCRNYLASYKTTIELGRSAFDQEDDAAFAAGVPEDLITAILAATPKRNER